MEKLNLNLFYQLGSQLGLLADMDTTNVNRLQILRRCFDVRSSVELLFNTIPTLAVCKKSSTELISQINERINWLINVKDEEFSKPDPEIDKKFRLIITNAKKLETVLLAELAIMDVFRPTQKGAYSTTDLIERAENTLEPVRNKINQKVIDEVRYSGRCLIFDIPTASGFHILRALEVVLYEYYLETCKPNVNDSLENWAAYISALYKVESPEVKKIVALLQQIKDMDRNNIMHAEIVLSADEAFALFETAKTAILLMASKLSGEKKHRRKKKEKS